MSFHWEYPSGDRSTEFPTQADAETWVGEVWQDLFGFDKPKPWSSDLKCITLTPASTGTDGFFFAVMQRAQDGG